MATRLTITVPDETARAAQRSVATGRTRSVSAYFAQAATERADADELLALIDEVLAENGGPPSAEEIAAADRLLGHGQ